MNDFYEDIVAFNKMYRLPVNTYPCSEIGETINTRLLNFKKTLADELNEIDEVDGVLDSYYFQSDIDFLTNLSDLLGDIIVYCTSEAAKFGLPIDDILKIIMESNMSKLGADGQPIYNEDGKVMKGPGYWKPEPRIKELLETAIAKKKSDAAITTKEKP